MVNCGAFVEVLEVKLVKGISEKNSIYISSPLHGHASKPNFVNIKQHQTFRNFTKGYPEMCSNSDIWNDIKQICHLKNFKNIAKIRSVVFNGETYENRNTLNLVREKDDLVEHAAHLTH